MLPRQPTSTLFPYTTLFRSLKKMEEVEIVGIHPTKKTVATDLEMFRKLLDEVQAGDNVGVLLRGIDKDQVERGQVDRKSTRLNSSHANISYAVFCLKKKIEE